MTDPKTSDAELEEQPNTEEDLEAEDDQGVDEDETRHRVFSSNPAAPVCDEAGQPLPARGLLVPKNDRFWLRRLRDGDATRKPQENAEHGVLKDRSAREKGV